MKIFSSHPVQYHVPLYRQLIDDGLDIEVGYYYQGAAGQIVHDVEFGIDFKWDLDLLTGYPHQIFLRKPADFSPIEQAKAAWSVLTWALRNQRTPLLLVGWFAEITWLVWLLRILSGAPTMILSETTPLSYLASPKPRWRISFLRWLLRHSSAHLFIGKSNHEFLINMEVPQDLLFHAPYSIDNARFAGEVRRLILERDELCLRHGLDPELPVVLFSGKLIEKKRPLQLLEAYLAAGLRDCAQLLYVGEGTLRSELERRATEAGANHIHVLGFLNQTQMPLAYVLGEMLCLISAPTETWGLVVNEALACGRPVIVSDTVGCAADLVHEDNGWIVPLDDHSALTRTLRVAFDRYDQWKTMGEKGREKVAANTFEAMSRGVRAALKAIQRKPVGMCFARSERGKLN